MSKKTPIGYLKCFCDFPDGEVRLDKNENPYYYCPDCSIQVLTHGGTRGAMFKAKMRPVDLSVKKAINEIDKKKDIHEPPPEPKKKPVKKPALKKPPNSPDEPPSKPPKKEKTISTRFGMMGGNS